LLCSAGRDAEAGSDRAVLERLARGLASRLQWLEGENRVLTEQLSQFLQAMDEVLLFDEAKLRANDQDVQEVAPLPISKQSGVLSSPMNGRRIRRNSMS
jgi:hypothetical protein